MKSQIPPISEAIPQGLAMQTLQPQHPERYRALPQVPQMYAPPSQQPPQRTTPRQRTAIACKYCRRRKIRCSGFDQSEDGRCTNCQRFSQECIFTPASTQTQAFVPAHTVWRSSNLPQSAQLYGAYGQRLLQHGSRDPYLALQQQPSQFQPLQQRPNQYPPPPQGYKNAPMYGQPPQAQVQTPGSAGQKGPENGQPNQLCTTLDLSAQGQRCANGQYHYLDPFGASPASSTALSFHSAAQAYYNQCFQPMRHTLSQSAYSYGALHSASSSPDPFGKPGTPSATATFDRTPPPGLAQPSAQPYGVEIEEPVRSGSAQKQAQQAQAWIKQEERTLTDSSMVQALGRSGPM